MNFQLYGGFIAAIQKKLTFAKNYWTPLIPRLTCNAFRSLFFKVNRIRVANSIALISQVIVFNVLNERIFLVIQIFL